MVTPKVPWRLMVRRGTTEPQLICNRDRVVAAVVDADSAAKLRNVLERARQRSVAYAFQDFRALAKRERYALTTRRRKNRRNSFPGALDHPPR
jgi:hypothetical protein